MKREDLVPVLNGLGVLTKQMVDLYFSGWTYEQIKAWLMENGFGIDFPIEHYDPENDDHYYEVGTQHIAIRHTDDGLKQVLLMYPVVTAVMINSCFAIYGFAEIRNWLETNALDPNMYLELSSTEIALMITDQKNWGILMQIRNAPDYGKVGFWGGRTKVGETPIECARRELENEAGIKLDDLCDKHLDNANTHIHVYGNGNKVVFHTNRFLYHMPSIPTIKINCESLGVIIIKGDAECILSHQREWVREICASYQNVA